MGLIKMEFDFIKERNEYLMTAFKHPLMGDHWIKVPEEFMNMKSHETLMNLAEVRNCFNTMIYQKNVKISVNKKLADMYVGLIEEIQDATEVSRQTSSSSASRVVLNRSDEACLVQHLLNSQQITLKAVESLFNNLQRVITGINSGLPQKLTIPLFDEKSEDPETWLKLFERACECNDWTNDDIKINNMGLYFIPGSVAMKWYHSRLSDRVIDSWEKWKASFLCTFSQNPIYLARKCDSFHYRAGTSIMEYYYEKSRLVRMAYGDIPDKAFIVLVLLGIPDFMCEKLLMMDINCKEDLHNCLTKLKPLFSMGDDTTHCFSKNNITTSRFTKHRNRVKKSFDNSSRNNYELNENFNYSCHDSLLLPTKNLNVNGKNINVLLDTGASVNLISNKIVMENRWTVVRDINCLKGFNGTIEKVKASLPIKIKLANKTVETKAFVLDNLPYDAILGIQTLSQLGYILTFLKEPEIEEQSVDTAVDINKSTSVTKGGASGKGEEGCPMVFSKEDALRLFPVTDREVARNEYAVPFKLKENSPVVRLKPYRLSKTKTEWAQEKISELLKKNIIRYSASKYASPCVIVPKENGSLRLCQDYRAINNHTELDPFPFPNIDDIICNFGGCEYFTKLDLKDGFHQVPLTEDTKYLTAFVLPFGHFEYNQLPFGWKNSPPIFQRFITLILGDLLKDSLIWAYVDDIIIGGQTKDECAYKTYQVLKKLNSKNLKINFDKSIFLQPEVTFLGRNINGQSKTTKQESVEKVKNMKRPNDIHTLRIFTGLTGHFRAFIPNYADIVRPLDRLKGKNIPFQWSEKEEKAFLTLRDRISSNPILQLPDWRLSFELCTDASHYGCGAILYQRNEKFPKQQQLRVIGYFSQTFTSAEINYSVTDKEALAVILSIKYFQSYLEGREFICHTDHQALTHIMNLKEPKGRLGRWQVFLMTYNIKINHRSGRELEDADAISRLCISQPTENVCLNLEIRKGNRISVSKEMEPIILKTYHDDPDSGGHDGFLRTYLKLKARFYWPKMKESVLKYVRSCHDCQISKFKFKPRPDVMVIPPSSKEPFETIHLDFAEKVKKSDTCRKTQSFLVLVDEFSKYVSAKAMKENSSAIITFLKKFPFISKVKRIVTDNGLQFVSDEVRKFAEENGIKLVTSAPYHPEANGLAERKIRDLKQFLSVYPNFRGGWKACLEAAVNHLNRSYSTALGCSPYFKAFGKVSLYPADSRFGITSEMIKECALTDEKEQKYKETMKKNFDQRHAKNIPTFAEDSQILVQCGRQGKHLIVKGPFKIKEVISKGGFPKTLLYTDELGHEKVAALKNVVLYHSRRNDLSQ